MPCLQVEDTKRALFLYGNDVSQTQLAGRVTACMRQELSDTQSSHTTTDKSPAVHQSR